MGTTDCRRHGFILVLVLFLTSISCLASKMDVNYDARGIKIEVGRKHNLSDSVPNPRSEFGSSLLSWAIRFQFVVIKTEKGYVFSKINFADYGHSSGDCGNFRRGNCGAPDTLRLVKKVRKINQH
ncbi:unnamed protein product [Arabidopsis thaliana]|uniref:Uncharacterized protein n=1 Tax=Arabidopsis thaliana TaxID=3702 RepID=A0A5S9XM09_ARATH|nr:unnamed protein product [Arabidopsis thaliana]